MIHPTADVSPRSVIGEGTKLWHQVHIREDATIGKNCVLGKNVYIDFGVMIGNNVKIQNNVSVYHGVTLEDDVFVGPSVTFTNDVYPRSSLWNDERLASTLVKHGASIGANATIVANTVIGRYALIGAGTVVTKNVPDHALVVGCPGRIIGFVCFCGKKLVRYRVEHQSHIFTCDCGQEVTILSEVHSLL